MNEYKEVFTSLNNQLNAHEATPEAGSDFYQQWVRNFEGEKMGSSTDGLKTFDLAQSIIENAIEDGGDSQIRKAKKVMDAYIAVFG